MGANNMKIAILSGKGGTGKTLLSVNLASVVDKSIYVDCDIEEPNGHLFFKPKEIETEDILVDIPTVDNDLCNGCRTCVNFCKFNALAFTKNLIIFEDICHSCNGCILLCPEKALSKKQRIIGKIQRGISDNVTVLSGILNTGEPSGTPIISRLIDIISKEEVFTFIDSPPGSACIVMDSIKDADYCILVAEPTLFGIHNLNMVYELVQLFNKPFGVVINKSLGNNDLAEDFCREKNIKILGKIPFDEELGILNSNGIIAARKSLKYKKLFSNILDKVTGEV